MDELSFNEESSELSSDNKEVSSDKEAALFGPLQPAQTQTVSLRSDDVPLLIANGFMDDIIFDEESSDVSSDNEAALLRPLLGPQQPVQTQNIALRSDDVPVLLGTDCMDDLIFDKESSELSSDNDAAPMRPQQATHTQNVLLRSDDIPELIGDYDTQS